MTVRKALAVALLAGAVPFIAPSAASAAPVIGAQQLKHAVPTVTETVQGRRWRGGGGWRGGRVYRGGYGYRYGYRGRGWGWGPAVGAGIIGGAIVGAGVAAAASAPPAYAVDDAVAYCMQRFRSYDPASGTYLGYDGLRHPCP